MRRVESVRRLLRVPALVLAILPALAVAQPVPIGPQFHVGDPVVEGTYAYHPVAAAAANGNFVIVWDSIADNNSYGLAGQRYDAAGAALGPRFDVHTHLFNRQSYPAVAADPAGDFVVVWSSGWDYVYGRRYDATGAPQGGEFQVDTGVSSFNAYPAVAVDADGDFVVAWQSLDLDGDDWGVFGRRYDRTGVPLGNEFPVNTFTAGEQSQASVAMDAGGNFVVVWQSFGQDGSSWGVFGQRFDAMGTPIGGEFPVNTTTAGEQRNPAVAASPAGDFVVAWSAARARRYDPAGVALGPEIDTTVSGDNPSVAMDAQANFVVAANDGSDVSGRRFDAAADAFEPRFQVNTTQSAFHDFTGVALDGAGNFVVTWIGYGDGGLDHQRYEVFAQRFAGASACVGGGTVDSRVTLTFGRILPPAGDESVTFRGKLVGVPLTAGQYLPAVEGFQVSLEDTTLELGLTSPTPVPPGPRGSGCGPSDGWLAVGTTATYKNLTNALPPACVPGSAKGLRTVKIKDRIGHDGTIGFQVNAKNATLPQTPAAPLTATLVLGSDAAASLNGRCAVQTFTHRIVTGKTVRFTP